MSPPRRPTGRGPLQPVELATAAVLGAMTAVLVLAGTFIPHAGAIAGLGVVPMGVIAYFHRPRAVTAAMVASSMVALIVAGTGVVSTVVLCGLIGGLAGHARARHWGALSVLGASLILGPTLAAALDGLLLLFAPLRRLSFSQLQAAWKGLAVTIGSALAHVVGTASGHQLTTDLERLATFAIDNWWALLAVVGISATVAVTLFVWWGLQPVIERLERVRTDDRLAGAAGAGSGRPVGPLPASLRGVTVRYPGQAVDALGPLDLDLDAGRFVVVLGPNGSGKSTLARVLAGVPPTSGTVSRPGEVGLGLAGGVAMIAQRPESQVLGVTVADDVVWGLPRGAAVDVTGLLAEVGLVGLEAKETAGLSGGQLQRLAIAAALARRPALLVSDESTAMVDVDGRHTLLALLSRIPAELGLTVVHVTHRLVETAGADCVLQLDAGRIVGDWPPEWRSSPAGMARTEAPAASPWDRAGALTGPAPGSSSRRLPALTERVARQPQVGDGAAPLVRVIDVSHTYAEATPWATVALRHVSLDIQRGEGILVAGGNGSGKSTLAWVLAGLLRPTAGYCELKGRPVSRQVGAVGLAFQHARLQIQRSSVGREVQAAGGVNREAAEEALRSVALDPSELWTRPVDQLSGGQLRRVALAGLLARRPNVLVLDEPLAGLDDASRRALTAVLADLRRRGDLTLVVVSHELQEIVQVCDRVVGLRGGRIVADETLTAEASDAMISRLVKETAS